MWSMPRSVLRIVAGIIAVCAVAGFVLGLQGTPEKGRLPGEQPPGNAAAGIDAPDVKPLVDEAPPPPPPEEEKKKPEEEPKAEVDPNAAPVLLAPAAPAAIPPAKTPPEDRVGDLLDGVTPPPQEDPPH
ncbi:MAG TPA: hypothetical protein VFW47_05730 [Phenylobacterium sp.]|nr:hypothetical protein [Phenylobacterium sp.]